MLNRREFGTLAIAAAAMPIAAQTAVTTGYPANSITTGYPSSSAMPALAQQNTNVLDGGPVSPGILQQAAPDISPEERKRQAAICKVRGHIPTVFGNMNGESEPLNSPPYRTALQTFIRR